MHKTLGVGYVMQSNILNTKEDSPNCPIARYKGESIGVYLYDTKKELIEAWNERM